MPIKSRGEVPNMPQNKQERQAVKRDETILKALEGMGKGKLADAVEAGRRRR